MIVTDLNKRGGEVQKTSNLTFSNGSTFPKEGARHSENLVFIIISTGIYEFTVKELN